MLRLTWTERGGPSVTEPRTTIDVSKQISFVESPGIDAITAAKIDEYTTDVAIDPDWSTHKMTWSSSARVFV